MNKIQKALKYIGWAIGELGEDEVKDAKRSLTWALEELGME